MSAPPLPPPAETRIDLQAWFLLLGSFGLLMVAYFTLPLRYFGEHRPVLSWLLFIAGLTLLSGLLLGRVLDILRGTGRRPGVWLVFLICLSLTLFAATYYVMAGTSGEFNGLSTRLDALYFTIVTMATVGYGDITAVGQWPRLIVILQIAYNFVFLAAAAGTLTQRVRSGLESRVREQDGSGRGHRGGRRGDGHRGKHGGDHGG
ncbi:potassium channel family protein [Kitasatospora sp. NPDC050463]|uniref:potassium channel family protein n=1 Tax=Kitasatospora sp. NPDC050463 TaxID=3155786 RepID=UPI0033CB9653